MDGSTATVETATDGSPRAAAAVDDGRPVLRADLHAGGFIALPVAVAADTRITPAAKLVYAVIADDLRDNVEAWPGQPRIAARAGLSERGVRNVVRELVNVGLIVADDRAGRSTRYRFTPLREPRNSLPGRNNVPGRQGVPGRQSVPGTPEQIAGPPRHVVPPTPANRAGYPTELANGVNQTTTTARDGGAADGEQRQRPGRRGRGGGRTDGQRQTMQVLASYGVGAGAKLVDEHPELTPADVQAVANTLKEVKPELLYTKLRDHAADIIAAREAGQPWPPRRPPRQRPGEYPQEPRDVPILCGDGLADVADEQAANQRTAEAERQAAQAAAEAERQNAQAAADARLRSMSLEERAALARHVLQNQSDGARSVIRGSDPLESKPLWGMCITHLCLHASVTGPPHRPEDRP